MKIYILINRLIELSTAQLGKCMSDRVAGRARERVSQSATGHNRTPRSRHNLMTQPHARHDLTTTTRPHDTTS